MMPDVFHQLQELDEKRIKNMKNFMIQSVDIERNVFPIISKCLDGIVRAAEKINEKEVRNFVYKSWNIKYCVLACMGTGGYCHGTFY
jgi:hypothetical protein